MKMMKTFKDSVMAAFITTMSLDSLNKVFDSKDSIEQSKEMATAVFNMAVSPYILSTDADDEFARMKTAERADFVFSVMDEAYRLIIAPVLKEQKEDRDFSLPVMLMANYLASNKGKLYLWRFICEIVRLEHKPPFVSGQEGKQTFIEALRLEKCYKLADHWKKIFSKLCNRYKV